MVIHAITKSAGKDLKKPYLELIDGKKKSKLDKLEGVYLRNIELKDLKQKLPVVLTFWSPAGQTYQLEADYGIPFMLVYNQMLFLKTFDNLSLTFLKNEWGHYLSLSQNGTKVTWPAGAAMLEDAEHPRVYTTGNIINTNRAWAYENQLKVVYQRLTGRQYDPL